MIPFDTSSSFSPGLIAVTAVVALLALLQVSYLFRRRSSNLPYPPGPKPEPFIGNLRQIPKDKDWITYYKWGKEFNTDVISIGLLFQRVVVLNSPQAAYEILDRRGANYSDRNVHKMLQMVQEGRDAESVVFMQYDDDLRAYRKVINTALNVSAVRDYLPSQERETAAFLNRLVSDPDNWKPYLRRMAGTIILDMTYGHQVTSDDDYLVKLSEMATSKVRPVIPPTSYLVNIIPLLQHIPAWFPGAGFKRYAQQTNDLLKQLHQKPFVELKQRIARGDAAPSYASKLLEIKGTITGQSAAEEEQMIKSTAGVMYGAGADTTVTATTNFAAAMALYPEVQAKCQEEIDRVLGGEKLPTVADEASLPYLSAALAESLRWFPIAPLGVPRVAKEDDVYEGMFIPKGSTVMGNIWAMLRDEKMYPEPFKFWPERFDGRYPQAKHPRNFVFGFNRRLCPGRHLAYNSLFTTAAGLIATMKISTTSETIDEESIRTIAATQLKFSPRSGKTAAFVRSLAAGLD